MRGRPLPCRDDLLGWLVGRVADADYQKLLTRFRGSDRDSDRALKPALETAVKATHEICPADSEQADRVAGQINKAFGHKRVPLPPGQRTLLEALQAEIAGQLSAADDAGQPPVMLAGVPVSELATKLKSLPR